MSKNPPFQLTREKHLDHMVKVVPFIVLMFGVQGYVLTKIHEGFGGGAIIFLAVCLVSMITAFITYDVKHQVHFMEDYLEVKFLGLHKKVFYADITAVHVSESNQSFASVQIRTKSDKHTFLFVDDADGIKNFLESRKTQEMKAAA
ncbi:MAG: hypothetical protein ACJ76H_15150 [Bacteriovoracaceae bacterium]